MIPDVIHSPDGKSVLTSSNTEIVLLDVTTGGIVDRIAESGHLLFGPCWVPDEKHIAYLDTVSGTPRCHYRVLCLSLGQNGNQRRRAARKRSGTASCTVAQWMGAPPGAASQLAIDAGLPGRLPFSRLEAYRQRFGGGQRCAYPGTNAQDGPREHAGGAIYQHATSERDQEIGAALDVRIKREAREMWPMRGPRAGAHASSLDDDAGQVALSRTDAVERVTRIELA
jgi:hypothetical protein